MSEPVPVVPSVDSPPETCSTRPEEVRKTIADEVTRLIAAIALADENFPRAGDLPRLAPVPHNHLGHQVLVDYNRLALILWGTAHEIQEAVRKNTRTLLAPLLSFLWVGACVATGAVLVSRTATPASLFVPVGIGLLGGVILYAILRVRVEKVAAEVRARNLRTLLRGGEPPSAEQFRKARLTGKRLAAWGDGELESNLCPVLVVLDGKEPFPGYGRHQGSQLFVCRPDDEASPPAITPDALNEAVSEALIRMVRSSGVRCVSSGHAVVIDGRSLRQHSPWLRFADADGEMLSFHRSGRVGEGSSANDRPPLFIPKAHLDEAREIDGQASVRVYTVVQAVLPEYLMCVTFFVRTFLAGNSAACEVIVSTLGPPSPDWEYVRNRLRIYDREQDPELPDSTPHGKRPVEYSSLGIRLVKVRFNLEAGSKPFTSPARDFSVKKIKPFDEDALRHEKEQVAKIADTGGLWPGYYTGLVNWREWYSLTFTPDFFGNTESRATLKTLYDRICRAALNKLKDLGFDIRDYQDESGHFSINADAIEHLVVGERVYMDKKPKEKKDGDGEPKPVRAEAAT
jgi:hypothetical protein